MEYIVSTFNLGNSVVSVWPKKLNVPANVSVKIKAAGGFVTATAKPNSNTTNQLNKNLELIQKLAGGMKQSSNMTPDEMNTAYDKEVYG